MIASTRPVYLALLGCGTVGGGVLQLLEQNKSHLAQRVGSPLVVRKVLVRDVHKVRSPACDLAWLTDRPDEALDDPEIDIVLELMGGEHPALEWVERSIARGLGVVTANKMLLALQGPRLVEQAVAAGVDLAFEASVGGGIPIIRTLREALTSDSVERCAGIVNGTCNFILSTMREQGLPFATVLADAQARGYAEADPALDINGYDAAHKLVVIAMLAFGARVQPSEVPVEGITAIESVDHTFAERFGFVIKHLAIGRDHGDAVELRVHPALVPATSTLANVAGVLNAIQLHGRALGPCLLSGRGAGALPTAVSVVADLVDVARARREGIPGLATRGLRLRDRPLLPLDAVESRFYLRFGVIDRPGVLSSIAGTLGQCGVSIEQMVQEGRGAGADQAVDIVMITHRAPWGSVRRALSTLDHVDFIVRPARMLRIEVP